MSTQIEPPEPETDFGNNAAHETPQKQAERAGIHEGKEPTGDSPVSENSMGAVIHKDRPA
jgi:hypothetical protein